jgi:hypothetical protein
MPGKDFLVLKGESSFTRDNDWYRFGHQNQTIIAIGNKKG